MPLYTRIKKHTLLLWGCLCLLANHAQAQANYPVMATVQLNPPYSLYLSDYAAPDVERMQVHLLMKDLTETGYKCRLQLTIEGLGISLKSKTGFYVPPILLHGGEMTTISGSDLAPYLNPQNLLTQGLDYNDFLHNGSKLPEGIYKFTIQVLDYTRNTVVSNASVAIVSTALDYPPIINMPMANTTVEAQNPQNLIIQWMPRSISSINGAFNVAYNLSIVEIIPADHDPNDAMRTLRPILQTLTPQTMYVYGPGDPPLTPGNHYAVQVQAIEATGRDMFENNGFSEVVPFVYGEKCGIPTNITAEVGSTTSLKLSWTSTSTQQAFTVRYREAGDTPSIWYEDQAYVPQYTITGLKQGKKYEFQVNGECSWGAGDYSDVQSFTMPDAALETGDFVCGRPSGTAAITNKDNLKQLNVGDTITAGDFKVVVKTVTPGSGTFTGTGQVLVPFLQYLYLNVTFNSISINTSKQLYNGVIQIRQDSQAAETATLQKTLTDLLDKIDNTLATPDTNSLKALDAASMLATVQTIQGWSDMPAAVKDDLDQLQSKLQAVQQLQDDNGITPDEKETMAQKLAADVKTTVDKMKADLNAIITIAKELLGIYKQAITKLRTDYTDGKVTDLKTAADNTLSQFTQQLQTALSAITDGITLDEDGDGATEVTMGGSATFMDIDTTTTVDSSGLELALQYMRAEDAYNTAKLVQLLDLVQSDSVTLATLIKDDLRVNDQTLDDYYKAQKDAQQTDDQIKEAVANAILKMIEDLLEKNIYTQP
jgi:hypothetical protein